VWFFSRSKQRLWEKGETSGNYLYVRAISMDCDQDSLIISVDPAGPVCHKLTSSCFDESGNLGGHDFLYQLEAIIRQRAENQGTDSYTRRLLDRGIDRIIQKLGEEAVEVVIASKNNNLDLLKGEISDLLYHLLVLMHIKEIGLNEISEVLRLRHERSTAGG
jgi:phosphoribosyl-ATP pyrophosphohydrolase/phosphoribosyl-AMP cyclohydrolase